MLCWPGSSFNQTVAIPCKDSNQFVAIIKQSKPSIEVTHIPGKICDVSSMKHSSMQFSFTGNNDAIDPQIVC